METKEPTYLEIQAMQTIGRNLKAVTDSDIIPGLDFALFTVYDCGGLHNPYVHLILHGISPERVRPLICGMNSYKPIDHHTIFGPIWKNPIPTDQLMRFVTLCEDNEYTDKRVNRKVTFNKQ